MRINEFQSPTADLFEDADVDQVLNVALDGDKVWSKPMSAEEAIALTLGKSVDKNAG